MIILQKEYVSEAGVSDIKKVKNPLNFSKILKNLMECKARLVRL